MIEVIIRDNSIPDGSGGTTPTPRGAKEEQGKATPTTSNINTVLIDYGRQILNEGINVALDVSGNDIIKNNLSTMTSAAADVLMIAKGGWVGVAAVTMKYATSALHSTIEQNRNVAKTQLLRNQAGKILELGGRYTND